MLRRTSTLALRQRKAHLLRSFQLPPALLHASLIEGFLKCGKANCRCHTDGPKHGPFFYLNRCFAKGQIQSLLLKSPCRASLRSDNCPTIPDEGPIIFGMGVRIHRNAQNRRRRRRAANRL